MRSRNITVPFVLCILLGWSLAVPAQARFGEDSQDGRQVAAMVGRTDLGTSAPELYGLDISGSPVSLESLKGKWVFIDFWATWCGPCMRELPNVVKMSHDLSEREDFEVIGVSLDNSQTYAPLKKVVSKAQINYPVIYDGNGATDYIADSWGVQAIPTTFLIDPDGNIAARDLSPGSVKKFIGNSPAPRPLLDPPTAKGQGKDKGGKGQKSGKGSAKAPEGTKPLPIAVRSSEELHNDSPSTGRRDMRDLQINISMPEGSRQVTRYQVFITASAATKKNPTARLNWLYDVSVNPVSGNKAMPWDISIKESSGKAYSELVNLDGSTAVTAKSEVATATSGALLNLKAGDALRNPSDIQVALDEGAREYQIIVPVPSTTSQLRYAIALYDDQLKQYIRNGLVSVDVN